mmetsp:Transcript_14025/g.23828  ORF Transcript_14025/g.23828 Transcript_14025/m.23828 type:complete len:193 (-) Transcript_14025:479-1057(-)
MVPGMNPDAGMLCGTNLYAIGRGAKRYLIDAGDADRPKCLQKMEAFLAEQQCYFEGIFITHSHYDHMAGAYDLIELLARLGKPTPRVYKYVDGCATELNRVKSYPELKDYIVNVREGDQFLIESEADPALNGNGDWGDITIFPIETAGHLSDHLCYLVKEVTPDGSSNFSIFTGDQVIGASSTYFQDYVLYY